MKKRFTFQCWQCPRTYTLYREITAGQVVTVACPYCGAEGVLDVSAFPRTVSIYKDGSGTGFAGELRLPDVLPTQPRE